MLDHAEPQEKQRSGLSRPERTGGMFAEDAVLRAARAAGSAASAADRDRRLAPAVVTALKEAGFARHFVPRRWGGREGGFADLITATALIAGQCPSAAWCGMLWAAHGRYAARLPEEGQRELWGSGPDTLIAAALAPPAGTARPVPGGWLLDGRWDCVSGVDFAHWVLLAAPVDDTPVASGATLAGPAQAAARVLAVPRSEVIVRDTWRSTGLRGTGSNSVDVRGVFVPDRRACPLSDMLAAVVEPGASPARQASALVVGGPMLCAPALGAARLALRSWTRWAAIPPAGCPAALGDTAVQRVLARSAAEIDAVALLLDRAGAGADAEPTAPRVEAVNRRDAAVAAELLVEAVERLFRTGGVHVRDDTSEVQRAWRDTHTVAAHGVLRLGASAGAYAAWGEDEWSAPMPGGAR
ncbi:acyl-CoA dehydrogenase family protein [Streptomyces sp. NBC_00124]|uniref:acyl-CoA dehydrogenase family protein n=1 Tax=Streptomyces sp. NBC_00124 TaxID=2975662 RepID=UPI002250B679|nr:acyl-CoA dehydrogenase family protein [Streptomyces sp. NBC_00124]MCX5358219.1 acyl-CoA dehydrogenase family protein [Streptomyces sp. NBC_00124]